MRRSFLPLILGLALAACTTSTDPGTTDPPGGTTTIAMKQMAELPMNGGDVTSIAITPSNGIIAAIDGKLYSMSASGGSMQLINGDATHATIGLAPSGELYAVTDSAFRAYDLSAGTYKSAPIDRAGPFAINRYLTGSEIVFSPSGEPYMVLTNNTPQTYIYHTADKGTTWKLLPMPPGFIYSGALTFAPNGDMLVNGTAGLFRSSDQGVTWTTYPAPQANYSGNIAAAPNGDLFYYVRGGGGLKVSRNGGASFTDLSQFNRAPFFSRVIAGSDGALYGLANWGLSTGLRRSTDGGVTWGNLVYAQAHDFAVRGSSIAIGLTASGYGVSQEHGGILTSQNSGGTWTSLGTKPVEKITDMGLDRDGNVMILADGGLFRKTSAGWQTLGIQPDVFQRFASAPQGHLLMASTSAVFHSNDNGATWTENAITDYQPGIDPASVSSVVGRKTGDFLISITSYADNRGYSNGHLYAVGADGKPVRNTMGVTLSTIVQDNGGVLYGSTSTLNQASYTFISTSYTSVDGGASWTEVTKGSANVSGPLAFNSKNRYLTTVGMNGGFGLAIPGSDLKTPLKLDGLSSPANYVTRVMFGPDDRLYMVTSDKGLYISDGAVR